MPSSGSEVSFGLLLLIEAAEHHDSIMVTPSPCTKKRVIESMPTPLSMSPPQIPVLPATSELEPSNLPSKKRMKQDLSTLIDAACLSFDYHSPSSNFKCSLIKESSKSGKCPAGSAHRIWEGLDESAMAARSSSRLNLSTATKFLKKDEDIDVGEEKTFVLYEKDDEKNINALHNLIRRDIWEGFVVDTTKSKLTEDTGKPTVSNARSIGRLARYDGTVGFRCRFCKHTPLDQRAERSAVYPRSLERIYLANIRFQRDHIEWVECG